MIIGIICNGNLSEGVRLLNKVHNRTYLDSLLYPHSLILKLELAIASGDTQWQEDLTYLYTWSTNLAATELADGVTIV